MVAFSQIPSTIRTPLAWAEFDASQAQTGPSVKTYKALVCGQKVTAGATAELVVFAATNHETVKTAAGAGSQLEVMAKHWFANNSTIATDFVAIDDAGGHADATGTFTVTGTATAAGTLYCYVNGVQFQVPVASGDTATVVGNSIVTAITADASARVTPVNSTGTVTCTAINGGEAGNDYDLRVNYAGESFPAGISVAASAMSGGSGNPDFDEIVAVLGEKHYDFIVVPWTDTTNFGKYDVEGDSRWDALRSIECGFFMAKSDTHSNLVTYYDARNSEFVSGLGVPSMPTPPDELAAMYAGAVARSIPNDPALPLGTLELVGAKGPAQADEFTRSEQDLLLQDGCSTAYTDDGGAFRIQRALTTYQTNALGATDTAFLDITTLYTLGYIRYDWRTHINTKYARAKVANDGTKFAPGQTIATPKTIKGEAISKYIEWSQIGLVEDLDMFKDQIIVERNTSNPTRIDVYMPPDLINPLTIIATKIGFKL